jgi:hypothetical protein
MYLSELTVHKYLYFEMLNQNVNSLLPAVSWHGEEESQAVGYLA